MTNDPLLMIPGPTNLPAEVQRAIGRPGMYHRGPQFAALLDRCNRGLQTVFQTTSDVLILSASGTGGVEAAIVNLLDSNDRVLVVNSGKFGERMGEIAVRVGAAVTTLDVAPGRAAEPRQVNEMLERSPFRALLFVHNETSTGVTQNVATLARIAHDYGCLTIVDCVSGMGGISVRTDEWGLDAVIAGSQKAFMLPPGLAFVALSERAWEAARHCATPRYYFDLPAARESLGKGQTPWTPAVNLIQGLEAALDLMLAEGMEAVHARHAAAGRATRAAMSALGIQLFADPDYASSVVTALCAPDGMDSTALVKRVREQAGIVISGGQGGLKGRIFRIGHLGTVTQRDIERTVAAVGTALADLGHKCAPEAAVAVVAEAYET